ncbi:hypothetical protein ACH42_03125 [Endozoicomonas sp. (ex Bugula neritina AB1)]|nr:hypothetical protein ACH42_03125 [Endozoicomonas sp. (ex Bugula neritina AB1)]
MKSNSKACLYALATALLWSTVATAFKIALTYLDPWQLVFWSVITSIPLLGGIILLQGNEHLIKIQIKQSFWLYVSLGILNPFLYHVTLFGAYSLLPAQQAQVLNYSWPMALTLLAMPLLGSRLTIKDLACCLLAYSGVLVISTRGDFQTLDFSSPLGVFLALSTTIIWALYWIFNTKKAGDPIVNLFICFLFGLPWIIASILIFSEILPIPLEGFAAAAYIGFIEMGFGYILWIKALKTAENTASISNISYLSPFLSLIFIANILGETIYPATYAGLLMIITAVIAQRQFSRK